MVLSQELNSTGEAIPGTAGEGSEIFIGPGPHFALGREGEGRRVAAALMGDFTYMAVAPFAWLAPFSQSGDALGNACFLRFTK